jgi:hypothetical protein
LNPNWRSLHPMIKHSMKKLFLLCMCSLGLYGSLFPRLRPKVRLSARQQRRQ